MSRFDCQSFSLAADQVSLTFYTTWEAASRGFEASNRNSDAHNSTASYLKTLQASRIDRLDHAFRFAKLDLVRCLQA